MILLDTPAEEAFDRLTRLASRTLGAPIALVSLIDEERQFFKSQSGLPEPWASRRETPLTHSFCQHVVASGAPLIITDARQDPLVRDNLAIRDLGVIAYAGIPLRAEDGEVLGAFCAIDHHPRQWSRAEMELLSDLAAAASAEIQWRAAREGEIRFRILADTASDAILTMDAESVIRSANPAVEQIFGYTVSELVGQPLSILIPERFREAHAAGVRRYLQTGRRNIAWRGLELPGLTRTGEEIQLEISFGAYVHEGEQVFTGFIRDISERKRAQAERDFLGQASQTLAASLDYDTTLAAVARLAVSRIADWCGVDLLVDDRIQRVAVAHADPAKHAIAQELRRYALAPDAPGGTPQAIRTGEPALYPDIPEPLLEAIALDPEHRRILRALGMGSAIVVPLIARGQPLGAIALISSEAGRRYGPRDLELAEELARRAAIAVDHARLYRQTEEARASIERQAMELELHMGELRNQAAELEESMVELEAANDNLQQTNARLAMAEAHYRRLVHTSPNGVFVLDEQGSFTEINEAGEEILARSGSEVLGHHFAEVVAPEDLELARDAFRRVITGQEAALEVELRIERPSGERRLESVPITAVRENGKITGVHGVCRDITEERRTQEALRESETSYRTLFDSLTEMVFIQDLAGRLLTVNEAVLRRYGCAREEIVGRTPDMLIDAERTDMVSVQGCFRRACGGEPQQMEIWGRTRDGECFPEEMTLTPGRYFGQDVVIAVARDVTEKRRLEERGRELIQEQAARAGAEAAERRITEIVESITDAFLAFDPEWRITYANSRAAALTRTECGELLGRNIWALYPQIRNTAIHDALQRAMSDRVAVALDYPSILRPGNWLHFHISPTSGGVALYVRDVTESKQAEEELARSQAELSAIIRGMRDVVLVLDSDGRYHWIAPTAAPLLYLPSGELIGKTMHEVLPAEAADFFLDHIRRALTTRQTEYVEYSLPIGEQIIWFYGAVSPMSSDQVVWVARDISALKQAEEALRTAKDEADRANRAKTEFLGRMSHELRTPLNAILGFGQLLESDVDRPENLESVEQILRAGRHLLKLIDEVLEIARIEAGQMTLSVEPVSVRRVLQESVDLVRLTMAKHGITMRELDALGDEHFVQADQHRLMQVLLNLLSNAIKYNRREGTVTLSCECVGEDHLRIAVQDTGYGIAAEKLERLFSPFDRLDQTEVEGTGLGLALSKGLVAAMGGRLGVQSVEDEGSRFWVELPLVPAPALSEPAAVKLQAETTTQMAVVTHTVLLIEDNLANVRLVERIFRRRPQVRLLTAMQGSLGLELAREHRPDLILLDLNLPDVSGDKVLQQVRQDPALRGIQVVMISGVAIPSEVQRLLELGAHQYVMKPFDIQELLQVVDENLQK